MSQTADLKPPRLVSKPTNNNTYWDCSALILPLFQCNSCRVKTTLENILNKHKRTNCSSKLPRRVQVRENLELCCPRCNLHTASRLFFILHSKLSCRNLIMIQHDPKRQPNLVNVYFTPAEWYQCEKCMFRGKSKNSLRIHDSFKHATRNGKNALHECNECPFRTKRGITLEKHKATKHSISRRNEESISKTAFSGNIKPNMRIDFDCANKWYECTECQFRSMWRISLETHVNLKHKLPDNIKSFKSEQYFRKHNSRGVPDAHEMDEHPSLGGASDEWKTCILCPYRTKHLNNLEVHKIRKHTDLKDINWLQCAHCSYKSKQKGRLIVHIKAKHISTKEK